MNTQLKALNEKRHTLIEDTQAILNESETSELSSEKREKVTTNHKQIADLDKEIALHKAQATYSSSIQRRVVNDVMPKKETGKFDLFRAVRARINQEELDGVEGEYHAEVEHRSGKKSNGIYTPMGLGMETRANFDTTAGASMFGVQVGEPAEYLRAMLVLGQAGCTIVPNLVDDFKIPVVTTPSTHAVTAEGNAPTADSFATTPVSFDPKIIASMVNVTKLQLAQTSQAAGTLVMRDMERSAAVKLDNIALLQMLADSGIDSVTHGNDGGNTTWLKCLEHEKTVEENNALFGKLAYITTPGVKSFMKAKPRVADTAHDFIWNSVNEVNGYPAYSTANMPKNLTKAYGTNLHALLFGNFEDAIFAFWGTDEILVDPYTSAANGLIRLIHQRFYDFQVRRVDSFSKSLDISIV